MHGEVGLGSGSWTHVTVLQSADTLKDTCMRDMCPCTHLCWTQIIVVQIA